MAQWQPHRGLLDAKHRIPDQRRLVDQPAQIEELLARYSTRPVYFLDVDFDYTPDKAYVHRHKYVHQAEVAWRDRGELHFTHVRAEFNLPKPANAHFWATVGGRNSASRWLGLRWESFRGIRGAGEAKRVLRQSACGVRPVTITGGHATTVTADGSYHVPKKELITALQVVMQGRRLRIARSLPDAATFVRELQNFQIKITAAANETFGVWHDGEHDDLGWRWRWPTGGRSVCHRLRRRRCSRRRPGKDCWSALVCGRSLAQQCGLFGRRG